MAKRIAEKELTDRNWDQEDEAEEVKRGFPAFNSPWGASVTQGGGRVTARSLGQCQVQSEPQPATLTV